MECGREPWSHRGSVFRAAVQLRIPLIVITSSGIMITDSGIVITRRSEARIRVSV